MDDHELLELAAKAAGYELLDVGDYQIYDKEWRGWNPLTSNGDALRLAMKLRISIEFDEFDYVLVGGMCSSNTSDDSVRLLIVKAAAEIGRNM